MSQTVKLDLCSGLDGSKRQQTTENFTRPSPDRGFAAAVAFIAPVKEAIALMNPDLAGQSIMTQSLPHRLLIPAVLLCGLPANAADPAAEAVMRVDEFLKEAWSAKQVIPADPCNRTTFIRRVFLDLGGRIPTPAEQDHFLAVPDQRLRMEVVDALLGSEDYVRHLADILNWTLIGREYKSDGFQRKWRSWLEQIIRENRGWDQVIREVLLARPKDPKNHGAVWFLYSRKDNFQAIAESIAPAVFGLRIECAQCHDHMLADEIQQRHYWGLVAFFNRGKNVMTTSGPRISESAVGGFADFADLEGGSSPNLLTFLDSKTVNETRPAADAKITDDDSLYGPALIKDGPKIPLFSRREKFVANVVMNHPRIARAFVNRIWALLFNRGIVHPFDEMDSMHPASHPELLDWLASDFRSSGYNIRHLFRTMALSEAYQLQSITPTGTADPSTFAWFAQKPLTAEQLTRSLGVALRGESGKNLDLRDLIRKRMPSVLPKSEAVDVKDALFFSNNAEFLRFLKESQEPHHLIPSLERLENNKDRAEVMMVRILGRGPTVDEKNRVVEFLDQSRDKGQLRSRIEQVVWAILTSAEFRYNH